MIRVLLAEDQGLLRDALKAILAMQQDIEVVADVGRGDQVLEAAITHRPDVAVIDIEMPGLDGLVVAGHLRDHVPSCKVLILTAFGRPGYLRRAVEAGALGFVRKEARPSELAGAIRRVAAGERVLDPALAESALIEGESPLTPRERDVLFLSLRGKSIADVSAELHLSEGTVRNHLSVAIQKLNATGRVEAAWIAEEKGWL